MTKNKMLLSWIEEMTALTTPDKVVWITETLNNLTN
jgi:GTP-dependent phosphoenolpyruvate carboxykinase